jgi:hypothetical protein
MIRLFLTLALAACLSACNLMTAPSPRSSGQVPSPAAIVALANPTLDLLEREYRSAAAIAEIFIKYLPDQRQGQIRVWRAKIEDLFSRARRAATIAEQLLAINAARREVAGFKLSTGG